VKEINSSVGFHTYTAIAMRYPDVLHDVKTVWEQMFKNVQLIFAFTNVVNVLSSKLGITMVHCNVLLCAAQLPGIHCNT